MSEDAPPLYTRAFWIACALHFSGGMSFGMFLLFPLFIRQLGGDELTIGLVLGTGIATSVVLRPMVGVLLDRLGRRRVLFWGTIANVASLPPFLLLGSPGFALYALSIVHFVAGGTLFAAYFTYASDLVPATRRVEGIAIFGVAGMAPNGLGPALGELLIARTGFAGFFAVATGFALVSLALITTVPRATPRVELVRASALERIVGVWREMVRMVLYGGLAHILGATALFGAGVGAAFYFVAPFTRDLGLAHAWPFFTAYASSTIALRILGRRLPDRLGAGRVAPPSLAVFALGLALLCFLPAPGVLVAAGIACGAGHGSLFPVMNALTVGRTPFELQGLAVSLYTAALDLGQTVGTPIGGAIARAVGYRVMFAVMAAASVGGLALMMRDRRRIPAAGMLLPLVAGLGLILAGPAAAADWPALVSGPLQDNSFLIEEAYNQEAGVVQHIVTGHYDRKSKDWDASFTQEWPLTGEDHQISFTVPFTWASDRHDGRGVGDVLLNYRYQLTKDEGRRPAIAPRLSLILPTGDFEDRTGTGSAGVQFLIPASKQFGDHFAAHLNAGVTIVPHARIPREPPRSERLTSWNGGGSVVWMPADAINFLGELVASRDEEMEDHGSADRTRLTFNPGMRVGWNGPGGVQWVWGLAFPIGLTAETDDFGVFLYFSAEHAVTQAAQEQRRW